MLHCTSPSVYIPADKLIEVARCPECNATTVLGAGVVHLGHYLDNQRQPTIGLIWTCSRECFLKFENSRFMGHC